MNGMGGGLRSMQRGKKLKIDFVIRERVMTKNRSMERNLLIKMLKMRC